MVKQLEGPILPFLRLDATIALPKFRQVQDQLRAAILKGHLRAGTRLPASRILAEELGLSRQTLVRVLENLKAEGYLEARQGAGTFVSAALPRPSANRRLTPIRRDAAEGAPPRLSRSPCPCGRAVSAGLRALSAFCGMRASAMLLMRPIPSLCR